VQANVGKPQVAYREAITRSAVAHGRFVRQSGGKGQFGDVKIRLERSRRRLRVRHEIVGGFHPQGVHQDGPTRASGKRWRRAFWPAIR